MCEIVMDLSVNGFDVVAEILEIDPWADDMDGTFEYILTKVDGHGHAHLPVNTDQIDYMIRKGLERADLLFHD